jgi:hypothetical protein
MGAAHVAVSGAMLTTVRVRCRKVSHAQKSMTIRVGISEQLVSSHRPRRWRKADWRLITAWRDSPDRSWSGSMPISTSSRMTFPFCLRRPMADRSVQALKPQKPSRYHCRAMNMTAAQKLRAALETAEGTICSVKGPFEFAEIGTLSVKINHKGWDVGLDRPGHHDLGVRLTAAAENIEVPVASAPWSGIGAAASQPIIRVPAKSACRGKRPETGVASLERPSYRNRPDRRPSV